MHLLSELGLSAAFTRHECTRTRRDRRRKIALRYGKNRKNGDPKYAAWQVSLDRLTKSRLPVPEHDAIVDASRDGQWILTVSMRTPRTPQFYRLRADATAERRVNVDGVVLFAGCSPDSRHIAYLRDNPEVREIHVVNVDGTGDRTTLSQKGTTNAFSPGWTWSPDGKQFAVVRFDWTVDKFGKKTLTQPKDLRWRIEIVNVDGTDGKLLELEDVELIQIFDGLNWRSHVLPTGRRQRFLARMALPRVALDVAATCVQDVAPCSERSTGVIVHRVHGAVLLAGADRFDGGDRRLTSRLRSPVELRTARGFEKATIACCAAAIDTK